MKSFTAFLTILGISTPKKLDAQMKITPIIMRHLYLKIYLFK